MIMVLFLLRAHDEEKMFGVDNSSFMHVDNKKKYP